MKNLMKLLIASLALVVCSACNHMDIANGEIPAAYAEQAKAWEGNYIGMLNDGREIKMQVQLAGNRVLLTSKSRLLGDQCDLQIGNLKSVGIDSEENGEVKINAAVFEARSEKCPSALEKNEIELALDQDRFGRNISELKLELAHENRYDCFDMRFHNLGLECGWKEIRSFLSAELLAANK